MEDEDRECSVKRAFKGRSSLAIGMDISHWNSKAKMSSGAAKSHRHRVQESINPPLGSCCFPVSLCALRLRGKENR